MIYNYLIIEDNPGAMENLQTAMREFTDFKCVGTAYDAKTGLVKALTKNPHIIFLDVELGDENGFEIMKEIRLSTSELPFIIMITDYSQYAKQAVNKDVLYFLDKPIDPDELGISLHKAKRRYNELKKHIIIKNTDGHFFLNLEKVIYLEADSNTCMVYLKNDSPMCVTKTLKSMHKILPPDFIRIHKSYIINKLYVEMMNTTKRIIRINCCEKFPELPIGVSYLNKVKSALLVN